MLSSEFEYVAIILTIRINNLKRMPEVDLYNEKTARLNNLSRFILSQKVGESCSFYVYIYILLCSCFLRDIFFFAHNNMISMISI